MKRLLIILLLIGASAYHLRASHIVGGDMSLQHVGGNNYVLTMRIFRDCSPSNVPGFTRPPLPYDVYVGMFDRATNTQVGSFRMVLGLDDEPSFIASKCIKVPTGCTEIGHYDYVPDGSLNNPGRTITFDPVTYNSTAGYYFSWEDCCRNTSIRNIITGLPPGGSTGQTLMMVIPPFSIVNSTPYFNKDPLTLLCTHNAFSFNYDVTDADGDSLVYSLITPLEGTTDGVHLQNDSNDGLTWPLYFPGNTIYPNLYKPAIWAPGYGLKVNIMDGNPDVKIDAHTGELTVTPQQEGIYSIAIKVCEYRKILNSSGQLRDSLLGYNIRELQFTVSTCVNSPPPTFSKDVTNTIYDPNSTFIAYATDSFCLPITISVTQGDSIYFSFSGDIFGPGGAIQPPYAVLHKDSGIGSITQDLCWRTTCNDASIDTYTVTLIARNNGCPFPLTSIVNTKIVLKPPPIPAEPNAYCGNVADINSYTISWDPIAFNKYFLYYVLVRINPDSSRVILDTITKYTTRDYFIDTTAYNNESKVYKYLLYGYNVCDSNGTASYAISTDTSLSKYPQIRSIVRVTVDSNSYVEIDWQKATEGNYKSYLLYRKPASQNVPFALYATIMDRNDTVFYDTSVDVAKQSYCYQLIVENQCGYRSLVSNSACSIVLEGSVQPFENNLQWNSYTKWPGGVGQYEILRQDLGQSMGPLDFVNPSSENINAYSDSKLNTDTGIYFYQVVAHEANSESITSVSNIIKLVQLPYLWVPNAFTPNGDGINDVWGIMPVFVQDFHLRVYNRWGELVYTSDDRHQQWNGEFQNIHTPDNVFIYEIEYMGWDYSRHYQTGNVSVLR